MKIVIDVGAGRYGGTYSIERLIEQFDPDVLHAIDPRWWEGMYSPANGVKTEVIPFEGAAWTHDGVVGLRNEGMGSWVSEDPLDPQVPCIDMSRFIIELYGISYTRGSPDEWVRDESEIILKIDAEGAEYEILDHLINTGADKMLELALVEWHDYGVDTPASRRSAIERSIRCPLEEWNW